MLNTAVGVPSTARRRDHPANQRVLATRIHKKSGLPRRKGAAPVIYNQNGAVSGCCRCGAPEGVDGGRVLGGQSKSKRRVFAAMRSGYALGQRHDALLMTQPSTTAATGRSYFAAIAARRGSPKTSAPPGAVRLHPCRSRGTSSRFHCRAPGWNSNWSTAATSQFARIWPRCFRQEVRQPDGARKPLAVQAVHRTHVASDVSCQRRELLRVSAVNQVEVEVVQPEVSEASSRRRQRLVVAVHAVPTPRGDERSSRATPAARMPSPTRFRCRRPPRRRCAVAAAIAARPASTQTSSFGAFQGPKPTQGMVSPLFRGAGRDTLCSF